MAQVTSKGMMPLEPGSGRTISPITAAALCIRSRPRLKINQRLRVDALKAALPDSCCMRNLAMRSRGLLLRGGCRDGVLDRWLADAEGSSIYGMRRFARTIRFDTEAVRAAITKRWSTGQTEGQSTRLKMLKRSMYGRAGLDVLKIRMLPFVFIS